jgi:hypothetical protein
MKSKKKEKTRKKKKEEKRKKKERKKKGKAIYMKNTYIYSATYLTSYLTAKSCYYYYY